VAPWLGWGPDNPTHGSTSYSAPLGDCDCCMSWPRRLALRGHCNTERPLQHGKATATPNEASAAWNDSIEHIMRPLQLGTQLQWPHNVFGDSCEEMWGHCM